MFQSLIGILQTGQTETERENTKEVSNPYRYSTNLNHLLAYQQNEVLFQTLIGILQIQKQSTLQKSKNYSFKPL